MQDGAIGSGGCVASLAAGIMHSAIDLGLLDEHIDKVCEVHKSDIME